MVPPWSLSISKGAKRKSQQKEHTRIVNVNAVDFFFKFKFYLDFAGIIIKQTFLS